MMVYFEYAVTWVFFMAIIIGLCLVTPKLAKKIDQWRESRSKGTTSDTESAKSDEENPQ